MSPDGPLRASQLGRTSPPRAASRPEEAIQVGSKLLPSSGDATAAAVELRLGAVRRVDAVVRSGTGSACTASSWLAVDGPTTGSALRPGRGMEPE